MVRIAVVLVVVVLLLTTFAQDSRGQKPPRIPDVIIRPPANEETTKDSDPDKTVAPSDPVGSPQRNPIDEAPSVVEDPVPNQLPDPVEVPDPIDMFSGRNAVVADPNPTTINQTATQNLGSQQRATGQSIRRDRQLPGGGGNQNRGLNLTGSSLGAGSFSGLGGVLRGSTSLFDSTAAASVRSQAEIADLAAGDMFHALQNEIGVLMQRTAAGQSSPFVRGLTGQQVLLMVDGVRMNNGVYRFGPNQYFNTIDPGMISQIEVLRGEGSVFWGADAIGGAINVRTIDPTRSSSPAASGMFTDYYNTSDQSNYTRVSADTWAGSTGVYAGGSFSNVRDLDTGFGFGRQPGTNFQSYSGDIKLQRLLSRDSMLTMAYQHYEIDDLPRSDRFPGYPGDRNSSNSFGGARFFDPQQRDLAYIRYEAVDSPLGFDAISFTSSYHRQRDVQTRGIPTVRFQETDVETVGFNLVGLVDYGDLGRVTLGGDWYHDDVDSPFGGTASGPIVPDDAYYERVGAFILWDVDLTQRLSLSAGTRYELIDIGATPLVGGTPIRVTPHFDDFVSQVGLLYRLTPNLNIVGSVAEGFRAPNLDELTANNPNVLQQGQDLPSLDLVPERSTSYQVGAKLASPRLQSEAYVFWLDLQNTIVPTPAGANNFRRANQDAFIQGCEWQGRYRLTDAWSIFGNFWYTHGINEVTQSPLSRIPPTQGIIGSQWDCGRLRFVVDSWLARRQDRLDPVRDLSDERIPLGGTPGYGLLNLRWGYLFGNQNRNRLTCSLENVTDEAYLVHGSGVFGTGITGRLGVQSHF